MTDTDNFDEIAIIFQSVCKYCTLDLIDLYEDILIYNRFHNR